jgi:hypothetical protein
VHPGAAWILPGAAWQGSERIPASDVLHIYRKRRPGQLRDVSWLAPILLRLRDLGDYEAALLMKAKIEACLAAVVTEEGEDALTGAASGLLRDAQGRTVESFEPGMILYRRGMGSVEVVNPSGGGSHAAFARRALEAAAVGTGLTYDQVSGDLTQANYSSLRAGKIEFRRLCEQVQYGMLIPMLVRPSASAATPAASPMPAVAGVPEVGAALRPAGLVWTKVPAIIDAFERGAMIRPKEGADSLRFLPASIGRVAGAAPSRASPHNRWSPRGRRSFGRSNRAAAWCGT